MKKRSNYKIAFIFASHEYEKWHAGLVHFISQVNLVRDMDNFDFFIFTDSKKKLKKNLKIDKLNIIETSMFHKKSIFFFIRRLIIFLFNKDYLLFYLLQKYKIKILSNRDLFRNNKIKSMCFIPDAGYLTLKNVFNKKELTIRKRLVEKLMKNSDLIYTHSNASKKTYVKQYKNVKIIPIRTYLNIYNKKPQYRNINIKKPVFYFPAQIWLHKNHLYLLELAERLQKKKIKCKFIFSGKKEDHRNPSHYRNIIKTIRNKNLNEYFEILGHINKERVVDLIRSSSALISPSRDEGWGFIKDEARYFGKFIFLSKIPGHKELKPPGTIFFKLNDITDLENKIIKFILNPPSIKSQKKIQKSSLKNLKLLKIIATNDTKKAYRYLLGK